MKKSLYLAWLLLSLVACGHYDKGEGELAGNYETITVKRSDITLEQTYPASIEGRQSIRIIPRVDGYLSEIRIKEGQRVRKGQVLFVIDQATFRAEEKAAKANVGVARAGVESAQLTYDSRKQLREKDIVSDYDLRTAATQLALARAQLVQAQAQWESARSNLSYTVLTSHAAIGIDAPEGHRPPGGITPAEGNLLSFRYPIKQQSPGTPEGMSGTMLYR